MMLISCEGCRERELRIAELQGAWPSWNASSARGRICATNRIERDLRPLTGEIAAMKAVRLAIQQVAHTDSTVLILGETGTGKELVARAIHQLSPRREHLLIAVNCSALRRASSPASCLAMRQERSPAQRGGVSDASSWPIKERSFLTRLAN